MISIFAKYYISCRYTNIKIICNFIDNAFFSIPILVQYQTCIIKKFFKISTVVFNEKLKTNKTNKKFNISHSEIRIFFDIENFLYIFIFFRKLICKLYKRAGMQSTPKLLR